MQAPTPNTTLVVVATNAVLDKADCKRTASAAHAGLARALNPSHTLADGDTVFCLATGAVALDRSTEAARQISLITLQSAAADVVRLAILDGIAQRGGVTTRPGEFGAYRRRVRYHAGFNIPGRNGVVLSVGCLPCCALLRPGASANQSKTSAVMSGANRRAAANNS